MICDQTTLSALAAFESSDKTAITAAIEEEVARNTNVHFDFLLQNKQKVGISFPTSSDSPHIPSEDLTSENIVSNVNKIGETVTEDVQSRAATDATR